ncbi:uncharacterized protein LOC117170288 [Belonocnema kinseyi]|uniref:uncharacterized protein LOC117170092 n=1 Tax=Belonocnema kinseyi TaxID=2817044 RepID=UPI00143D2CD5|nr:uncharacterized protein LOC117170092 [Belonocnema kinseyi]XP_033212852.1 uncharacterized protein LOC117170288 [Belonocnema kinseyi]
MFKFVILAVLLAFANAEPGHLGVPLVTSYSGVPATLGYPGYSGLAYSAPAAYAPAAYAAHYGYAPSAYSAYSAPLPYAYGRSIHY